MKKRNLRLEKKMYNYLVSTDHKDRSILFQIIEGKACFRDIKDLTEYSNFVYFSKQFYLFPNCLILAYLYAQSGRHILVKYPQSNDRKGGEKNIIE